jgi:hypothetical protein
VSLSPAAKASRMGMALYVPEGEVEIFADPVQHFRERQTYIIYDNIWDTFAPIEPAAVRPAHDHEVLELAGIKVTVVPLPGGGVRAVLELAGIRDILAKSLGTTNPINMAKATVNGLKRLRSPDEVARSRGLTIKEVLPYKAPKRTEDGEGQSNPGS